MVSGLQEATRRNRGPLALVVLVVILAVASSVYAGTHRTPRHHVADTDDTMQYEGFLWGDWQVGADADGVYAEGSKIDTLATNPPYPPYYTAADNEATVRIGTDVFGFPKGDNAISEVPIHKLRVSLITVAGATDGIYLRR